MSITLRYMSTREEAEELLNDIFLKIFQSMDKYCPDYPFKIWIRRIAINTCIDRLRVMSRIPSLIELGSLIHTLPDTDDTELARRIQNNEGEPLLPLLHKLSPRYRAVFNLYVFEEYTHKEIGAALGISEGTSKSNYARAKSIIKNALEKKMKENKLPNIYMAINSDTF
ncbi:MAG: RNA polymerase sigma factor [Saprospiraceae bacterium]|nr:RNA polymerase sigma factor [Saprospiraceae bacterium]